MLPSFERRSVYLALLGLSLVLAAGLLTIALVSRAGDSQTLIPWAPANIDPLPTATSPSGWWQDLPTPAPVIPGFTPKQENKGD